MKCLLSILLLCTSVSYGQSSPSAVLKYIMKANDEARYGDMQKMLWSKTNQEEILKTFQTTKEKFGVANYFLQTDSVFKAATTSPQKYFEFKYNTYYQKDLLRYEFVVVEEQGEYKLASFIYSGFKGNYDDVLLNHAAVALPKAFLNNIVSGKTTEAYKLFAMSLRETLSQESFQGMVDLINETLGEFKSIEFIDTCTALNYYGENESIGLFSAKLIGSKGNLFFNGTVAMNNSGVFFLTRFQIFEHLELNNAEEMATAKTLLNDFYFAWSTGAYDKLYQLLHPQLQEMKKQEDIVILLEGLKTASGKHASHDVVSSIFSRNQKKSDLNKFMVVVKNVNQEKVLHDNFLFSYDRENNLKISYFYFVEY